MVLLVGLLFGLEELEARNQLFGNQLAVASRHFLPLSSRLFSSGARGER